MAKLSVRNLTPEFGAEVAGIDLSAPLGEDDCRQLRELFDDRGVLVFRDVEVPDIVQQQYLSDMVIGWSEPEDDAADGAPRRESYISNKEEGGIAPFGRLLWHSDMMWSDKPFQSLSLFGTKVEQPSVPTLFVSATRAWDALPDELRLRVSDLHAVQVTGQVDRGRYEEGEVLVPIRTEDTTVMPIRHGIPQRAPSSTCASSARAVVELPGERRGLAPELFGYLYDPAFTFERSGVGDCVVWDNLALLWSSRRRRGTGAAARRSRRRNRAGPMPETPASAGRPEPCGADLSVRSPAPRPRSARRHRFGAGRRHRKSEVK
jgi:taurine dioxygenase